MTMEIYKMIMMDIMIFILMRKSLMNFFNQMMQMKIKNIQKLTLI